MKEKKFALITGGSEGVGQAIAEMLARRGYFVLLAARDKGKLEIACARMGKGCYATFSCDVTELESIKNLRAAVLAHTSELHALVNAAGTFKWDVDGVDLMKINATSKRLVLSMLGDLLVSGAVVVNVSSQAALFAPDDPRRQGEEGYVAAMQAVDRLSDNFQKERPDIRVIVPHPSLMKGKIAETNFCGRPGFEDIDCAALPGPEIVAKEVAPFFE